MHTDLNRHISQVIGSENDYIMGFADLSGLLPDIYGNHTYGIIIGKKLDTDIIDKVEPGPSLDYYRHYKQINTDLSELVHRISAELNAMNISTIAIEPTISDDALDDRYYKTLRTNFSHKMAGTRAGLGWIGKTALFISKKFGPRLRLATLLTDHRLECSAAPIDESKCGKCNICVEKCPAQAANGKSWTIHTDRDEFFNPFKCREKCLELSMQNMNLRASICGICVSVCPWGKR